LCDLIWKSTKSCATNYDCLWQNDDKFCAGSTKAIKTIRRKLDQGKICSRLVTSTPVPYLPIEIMKHNALLLLTLLFTGFQG